MNVEITRLIESLNDRQREAALAGDGSSRVPAGRAARGARGVSGRDVYHAGGARNA